MQGRARPQYPPQLAQRGGHVGDGTQRPGAQRDVVTAVRERERLAVQVGPLYQDRGRGNTSGGQLPGRVRGLYRRDAGYGWRMESNVQPGTEADLDNVTGEPAAHPPPQRLECPDHARRVKDTRKKLIPVQSHGCQDQPNRRLTKSLVR